MQQLAWWQKAIFYQIYPRSFADGNGDGIGDLQGMLAKLDYLQELGVDAIWLSPHYPSPLFDCGYDVADYTAVAPEYGSLEQFKQLLDQAHARGIRVVIDLVVNHTSDQHPWFLESRSSRDNPKRDWYVWRDPAPAGGPPNNWSSLFGGSAWEHDPATGQYYYHFFFKQQPDLNWRNPEVKQAMFQAVRFWLDMGVDGFRLDAIGTLFEHPDLPANTSSFTQLDAYRIERTARSAEERQQLQLRWEDIYPHQVDQPGIHELMRELRAVVDEYPERVLIGETDEISYYGNGQDELHMVFNFPLMQVERLTADWVRANQHARLGALPAGAWPCNTLNNHDSPRVYSRYGDGRNDAALARLSLALLVTLRGTLFLYNGEEIGMTDLLLDDVTAFRDMLGVWAYHTERELLGSAPEEALAYAARFGRDKSRTPLQWANAPNGGFCPAGVQPWLPVNLNYARGVNVDEQLEDPGSLLNFYRRMLWLRKQTPALMAGDYTPLHDAPDYLSFVRSVEGQRCLVILNLSEQAQQLQLAGLQGQQGRVLFSSQRRAGSLEPLTTISIAPFEIYIAELE